MEIIEIFGDNYFGKWEHIRTACRAVVIRDGKLLLSYETATDTWMIPGGGLEPGENEIQCCVRETAEETGFIIQPSPCVLETDEYYEDCKYISMYFFGTIIGQCERKLTQREKQTGMEPRWLCPQEALSIFSRHASYAAADEMKRGLYLREYTALCALIKEQPKLPDA